jgi:endoglucanase
MIMNKVTTSFKDVYYFFSRLLKENRFKYQVMVRHIILAFLLMVNMAAVSASKLVETKVLDQDYIMLVFKDGTVTFIDEGKGKFAYEGTSPDSSNSMVELYGTKPFLSLATKVEGWTIQSKHDARYGKKGLHPAQCFRKTMVNGTKQGEWKGEDWEFEYTYDHFIYLKLPYPMEQGKEYEIIINPAMYALEPYTTVEFDIFNSQSEAIHTNLVGYPGYSMLKPVDIYHFMGDGGSRDYSSFIGNKVYLYDLGTKIPVEMGKVSFWMKGQKETQWNLTGSDVWIADMKGKIKPGNYKVAVEGIGCSQPFEIRDDIYKDPFKISVLGYFYMRIGEDSIGISPVPRRPLWIPGKDPENCQVKITDMSPYHPEWKTFTTGDKWDRPADWERFTKAGNPINPNAYGGHSDALDWDRHLSHVSNIYDMLLAYIITNGAISDDDCRIAESGNGIPDILDEARNEVDFWLRLRYGKGYSHGLTNPDAKNVLYQADNTPMAAWANALNCAMMAYAFEIAGMDDLKGTYMDSSIVAFGYASQLPDPMHDVKLGLGQAAARGRDLKMMAAAYLYNLTGNTLYENIMKEECVVDSPVSEVFVQDRYNQLWGIAAYLFTKRKVNYPVLQQNMKTSVIHHAKIKEADMILVRPSRRGHANDQPTAWFQTAQDMPRTLLAHAISDNADEKEHLLNALILEADWGLGRNPLNMIQMTTATTSLASKRSVENCYTSGRDDGTPGLHPGHTPYLNTESWGREMIGSNPAKILKLFYPDYLLWPHASKYINTRYIWAHSEFTPRQTMRFKTLLYAYLYGLSKNQEGLEGSK